MWQHNGRTIKEGLSWTSDDGIKHPSNWAIWSDAVKKSFGLVQVDDPVRYNSFFYNTDGTAKALDDVGSGDSLVKGLKTVAIESTKRDAKNKLSKTDWHVVKAAEVSSYTVPSDVTTYRAAVRTASNTIESTITNAADHAAFMALYITPTDSDGRPTGNAPINDWPDEI